LPSLVGNTTEIPRIDLTDIPDDVYAGEESPLDLNTVESPDSLLKGGSTRERLLDVLVGLRTPMKISTIAERADCDTETARDYLKWFDEMGMVQRHDGRPIRYERNDAYFHWRRIDRIRQEYPEQEIVDALGDILAKI
jgi:predicted ArsR family transcriptional regulator